MAKKNEAKVTFLADTKSFRENVNQANNVLRNLSAELRLNAEEMKTNGTSVDALTERKKLLEEQLDQAKNKTQNLAAQMEAATRIYGENSAEVLQLETRITNARIAEERIQQEIDRVKGQLIDQAAAANKSENALEQLERTISEQESALSALKREYEAAALEFGENSDEAQELARRITDLSGELNQNRSRLSDVQTAADRASDSFDDLADNTNDAAQSADDSADGWSIVKDVIADLASQALQAAIEGFKELAFESEVAIDKLQAQIGASSADMEKYGEVARDIFKNGWGESLADVTEAIGTVTTVMGELDKTSLQNVTENAMTCADVFGWDVKESVRAANSLMDQFGISSEEAFNLMIQGAQEGLDQNDDLLDTINEYSVQFKQAGYSADDMLNMMVNGAKKGTWSVDKLGDAVKEVNISIKDGTADEVFKELKLGTEEATVSAMELTDEYADLESAQAKYNEAVRKYGENSEQAEAAQEKLSKAQEKYNELASETTINIDGIKAAFAAGGTEAQTAMQLVMTALMDVEDETERYTLGVQLFGTMWEDLGEDSVEALLATEGGIRATNDAMAQVKTDAYDNLATSVTTLGRSLKDEILTPIVEEISPAVKGFVDWCNQHMTVIAPIIKGIAVAFGILAAAIAIQGTINLVTKAFAILNITLLSNPILLVAAAVAGLVVALSGFVSTSDSYRSAAIENAKATTEFQRGLENLQPSITAVEDLTNKAGQSVSDLDRIISEAETNITKIMTDEYGKQKQLRDDDIADIKEYNQQIHEAKLEQLNIIRQAQDIELTQLQRTLEKEGMLTQEAASQAIVDARAAYEQSAQATQDYYDSEYARIVAFHTQKGTLNSEEMHRHLDELDARHAEEVKKNEAKKNAVIEIVAAEGAAWADYESSKWENVNLNAKSGRVVYETMLNDLATENNKSFLQLYLTAKSEGAKIPPVMEKTATDMLLAFDDLPEDLDEAGKEALTGLISGMEDEIPGLENMSEMTADEIVETITTELGIKRGGGGQASTELKGVGRNAVRGLEEGIKSEQKEVETATELMAEGVLDTANEEFECQSPSKAMKRTGQYLVEGLASGIETKKSWLTTKLSTFASGVKNKINDLFGVESPSRVTAETGKYLALGLAVGIEDNADAVLFPMHKIVEDIKGIDAESEWNSLAGSNASLRYDVSAQLGDYVSSAIDSNSPYAILDDLIDAVEDLASRAINIDIDSMRVATATAGASDSVSGNRLNLKTRGLAL